MNLRLDRARSHVLVRRASGETRFEPVTACFPDPRRPIDLELEVAFAGVGITAPEVGYDDYAGLEVTGKAVPVFDHEPQEDDPRSVFHGTGSTLHANAWTKTRNAERHGGRPSRGLRPQPGRLAARHRRPAAEAGLHGDQQGRHYGGANDNGSGVAALLEAARQLARALQVRSPAVPAEGGAGRHDRPARLRRDRAGGEADGGLDAAARLAGPAARFAR